MPRNSFHLELKTIQADRIELISVPDGLEILHMGMMSAEDVVTRSSSYKGQNRPSPEH